MIFSTAEERAEGTLYLPRMHVRFFPLAAGFCIAGLALVTACGGGGGSSSPVPPVGSPATPTPVSSSGPQACGTTGQACVMGTVVDASHTYVLATPTANPASLDTPAPNASPEPMPTHAPTYGLPLAGVPVALLPWTSGNTTPVASGVTAANGTFALPVAPGHYLLVVGNNTPVPYASPWPTSWQTTLHMSITVAAGNAPIVVPTPLYYPNDPNAGYPSPSPVQASGNLRIQTLVEPQLSCFIALNAARAAGQVAVASPPIAAEPPAPPEIADEFVTEYAQAQADQMAQVYPAFPANGVIGTGLADNGLYYTEPLFGFGTQLQYPNGAGTVGVPVEPVTTAIDESSPGAFSSSSTCSVGDFENNPFMQSEFDDPLNVWQGHGASNIYSADLSVYDIR